MLESQAHPYYVRHGENPKSAAVPKRLLESRLKPHAFHSAIEEKSHLVTCVPDGKNRPLEILLDAQEVNIHHVLPARASPT